MICKNCGAFTDDSAKFCMYCGTQIVKKICSNCDSIMPEVALYCSECGQKLSDNTQSVSTDASATINAEDEYGYEEYDEYDEADDYENYFEDEEINNTSAYVNNTNIPTLDNYKDLGIDSTFNIGYFINFQIPSSQVNNNDPYSYIYGPEKKYTFEKCNLYDIYHFIIVSDGIFYATRNEAIFLHKNGLKFSVKIENICSLLFNDTTLTITHIESIKHAESWEEYWCSTAETKYEYSYILNNLS